MGMGKAITLLVPERFVNRAEEQVSISKPVGMESLSRLAKAGAGWESRPSHL